MKLTPIDLIRFMNKLPIAEESSQWLVAFKKNLQQLFEDVDNIVVSLCCSDNMLNVDSGPDDLRTFALQQLDPENMILLDVVVIDSPMNKASNHLLDNLRRNNRPLDDYHAPIIYDYFYQGRQRVGSILLFREKKKPPISRGTIALIESLEPFIIFALSDAVTRLPYMQVAGGVFYPACNEIANTYKLTDREREVLIFHVFGFSYQKIASKLHITVEAVKKRVLRIHQKAGVKRYSELLARHFAPLLMDEPKHK